MKPKAHLFVVDDDSMPMAIQKRFCGIIKIQQQNRAEILISPFLIKWRI